MKNMSKVRNLDMNTYFSTIQDYEDTDLHMKGFPPTVLKTAWIRNHGQESFGITERSYL